MNVNELGTMRRPAVGWIAARQTITVQNTGKPIDPTRETVMVLASSRNYILVKQVGEDEVILENTGPIPVAYSMFIVPVDVVDALKTPWRQLWDDFKRRLKGT